MPTDPLDLVLRPGVGPDLEAVRDVWSAAAAHLDAPFAERTPEEARAWLTGLLDRPAELWVATEGSRIVGFVHLEGAWLSSIYVHPDQQGRGVGTALLDLVKALRPAGFGLRVHETNTRARELYRRRGLVELERTDGSSYRDEAPDLQMAWLGEDPLGYLRGRIDEVDDELAVLLARRVALTAAVQDHKEIGGHAGRDPGRETEIVERMARRVPDLGVERIRKVMHAVIAESLAAWEDRPSAPS